MNPKSGLLKNDPCCSQQRGYSLIELSIVLIIITGMVAGLFSIYQFKQTIEKAETIAGQYKKINAKVDAYTSANSDALLELLNKLDSQRRTCDEIYWRYGDQGSGPVKGCELIANGKKLAVNGAQPTLDELRSAGYLDPATPTNLPLATDDGMKSNGQTFESRFAVQITRSCVKNTASTGPASNSDFRNCKTADGVNGYWVLSSLLFNSQPFADTAIYDSRGNNLLYMIFRAAGSDALIAAKGLQKVINSNGKVITREYPLIAASRKETDYVDNPLVYQNGFGLTTSDRGVPNVLAMRGGFGSDSLAINNNTFKRLDGSNSPTADWNFAGFNLNKVGTLAATNVNADQKITAGGTGDAISATEGNITAAKGNITAAKGNISADKGNIYAAGVVTGDTRVEGPYFKFTQNNTNSSGLKEDDPCTPNQFQSITFGPAYMKDNKLSTEPHLLRCDGSKWVYVGGSKWVDYITLIVGSNGGGTYIKTVYPCDKYVGVLSAFFQDDWGENDNGQFREKCAGGVIFADLISYDTGGYAIWQIFRK